MSKAVFMTDDAYNDLLRGNGYHLLRSVISAEEAATVRIWCSAGWMRAWIKTVKSRSATFCTGAHHSKYGNSPYATGFGAQTVGTMQPLVLYPLGTATKLPAGRTACGLPLLGDESGLPVDPR